MRPKCMTILSSSNMYHICMCFFQTPTFLKDGALKYQKKAETSGKALCSAYLLHNSSFTFLLTFVYVACEYKTS